MQSAAEAVEGGCLASVQEDHTSKDTASTDKRRMEDLTSNLIPSEMPYGTETVWWPNSQVTILPTVMINRCNVLENDAKCVRQIAALPISLPTSSHVNHIDATVL
jgi:hypothetical protein